MDARACRGLWLVILASALDDLKAQGKTPEAHHRRRQADAWFRSGQDMLMVAALAGLDGRLIRQRYLASRISSTPCTGPKRAAYSAA